MEEARFISLSSSLFRQYRRGSQFAVLEIRCLCARTGRPTPTWAKDAVGWVSFQLAPTPQLPSTARVTDASELLRYRRNFFRGFLYAALQAHCIYLRLGLDSPDWVLFGIEEIKKDIVSERTGTPGRPKSRRTKYAADLRDQLRLDMVHYVQEKQSNARYERQWVRRTGENIVDHERGLLAIGRDRDLRFRSDETYQLAIDELQGTNLAIGIEGLRSSCKRARAREQEEIETGLLRFDYLTDPPLRSLGLERLTDREFNKARFHYRSKSLGEDLRNLKALIISP